MFPQILAHGHQWRKALGGETRIRSAARSGRVEKMGVLQIGVINLEQLRSV